MIRIRKFTLGIRPAQKMFRVSSLHGSIVDSVLSLRGTAPIDDEYYTEVTRATEPFAVQLKNEERGNIFTLDLANVTFTKDLYDSEKVFNIDDTLKEFRAVWKQVNDVLHIKDIRRVGLVAEHQLVVEKGNPSFALLKKLTSLVAGDHVGKFHLHFEERTKTKKGGVPDLTKDDFINVIRDYYDSERDVDHPRDEHFNVNLDVQRYYAPLFTGNIFDEVTVFRQQFAKEEELLEKDLKQRGLL